MTSEDTAASLQSQDPRYGFVVSITGQDRKMFRDGVQVAGDPDVEALGQRPDPSGVLRRYHVGAT